MTTDTIDAGTREAPPSQPQPIAAIHDMTKSWFFGPDDGDTLNLPGGHTMRVLPEMPIGLYVDVWNIDESDPTGSFAMFKIFSKVKLGVTPEINAICTILVGVVTIGVICASLVTKRREVQRQRDEQAAAAA